MKKVAVIGANDFQNPLILRAKELGYETHVFAWQDGSVGERTADYFYPISILNKEEILEKCRQIRPDAVATIASDLAAVTAAYVAGGLGLTANSAECVMKTTNKYKMREAFRDAGIPVPSFVLVDQDNFLEQIKILSFPVIVKPTDRSGSRSITKVLSSEDLKPAVLAAVQDSFEKKAIIETLIDGEEYSMEAITFQGFHHLLAFTKKYTTGSPHFIETGHMEPAGFTKEQESYISTEVFKALSALGVEYGASHSEFRINSDGEVRIIEIGARMGGDCIGSHLVPLSTGYDFVKMVLDTALGKEPELINTSSYKASAVRFILEKSDLERLEDLKITAPACLHHISHMDPLNSHAVVDSGSRYGYYIVACDSAAEAKRILV